MVEKTPDSLAIKAFEMYINSDEKQILLDKFLDKMYVFIDSEILEDHPDIRLEALCSIEYIIADSFDDAIKKKYTNKSGFFDHIIERNIDAVIYESTYNFTNPIALENDIIEKCTDMNNDYDRYKNVQT